MVSYMQTTVMNLNPFTSNKILQKGDKENYGNEKLAASLSPLPTPCSTLFTFIKSIFEGNELAGG